MRIVSKTSWKKQDQELQLECKQGFFLEGTSMLGKSDTRLDFEDSTGWRERIPRRSFWWRFRLWADERLRDEDFSDLFSEVGRPSVSPARVVRGILVQLEKGYSDRELEEESAFDDRVKLALGMRRGEPGIDAATLCRHRRKLFSSGKAEGLLTKVVGLGRAEGVISEGAALVVDSFLAEGAGARQDTVTLIRRAALRVLKTAQFHGVDLGVRLLRDDYGSKKKPAINWRDPSEKARLVETLVKDGRSLVGAVEQVADAPEELREAAALLRVVTEQDIKEDEKGIRIRDGVAKDRVLSVVDPEMRHGRKSASKKVDGYKVHVAAGGDDGGFITAVVVTAANKGEGERLGELIDSTEEKGVAVASVTGDTAYGGGPTRAQVTERNVDLIAPVPPAPNPEGKITKKDFEVNVEEGYVKCPAGVVTRRVDKGNDGRGNRIPVFRFPAEECGRCPLKDICAPDKGGRRIRLNRYEGLLQEARKREATDEFKELYRKRCSVERTICHMQRHGGRVSRYIGLAKTRFQMVMAAVLHDIKQLVKPREAPPKAALSTI